MVRCVAVCPGGRGLGRTVGIRDAAEQKEFVTPQDSFADRAVLLQTDPRFVGYLAGHAGAGSSKRERESFQQPNAGLDDDEYDNADGADRRWRMFVASEIPWTERSGGSRTCLSKIKKSRHPAIATT